MPLIPLDPRHAADVFYRQALLNEKRRRRRESHNAVERRRRDNINEKISEEPAFRNRVIIQPAFWMQSAYQTCQVLHIARVWPTRVPQ